MQGWSGIPCNDYIIEVVHVALPKISLKTPSSKTAFGSTVLETVTVQGLELKGQGLTVQAFGSRKGLCTYHQATSTPFTAKDLCKKMFLGTQ